MPEQKEHSVVETSEKRPKGGAAKRDAATPRNRVSVPEEPALPIGHGENALHVGIDLGTSRTSVSSSG